MDDKTFFDKACNFLLPLAWGFLLLICVFIFFSSRSNAADNVQSPDLYYPIHQNDGGQYGRPVFDDGMIQLIESLYDSENNYIFAFYSDNTGGLKNCYISYCSKANGCFYGEIKNDMSRFGLYVIATQGQVLWQTRLLRIDPSNYSQYQNITINNNVFTNLGYNDYSYVSNFQMYNNNNPDTQIVILAYGDGDDNIPDDNTVPDDYDKPLIDNYLPNDTTPPTFDNSSVESALGSIFDYLQFQTNKISGTITGVIEYLSDSLMWGLQRVINNIRSQIQEMTAAIGDKIDEVISGIGSSIDMIKDSIDYIIEPFDSSIIQNAFVNTDFGSIITDITSLSTAFDNAFDFNEPDSFDIIIHVENISILNQSSAYTLHLGPHFLPFRTALRTFLWCLVSVGIVFYVEKQLANALRGEVNK